jgi:hypothetical protein
MRNCERRRRTIAIHDLLESEDERRAWSTRVRMAIVNGRQRGHAGPDGDRPNNAVAAELGDRAPQVVEAGGAVVGDPFCDRSIPRQQVQRRGSWSVVSLGAEALTQPRDRSGREVIFRLARDCGGAGNPRREVAPQHNSVAAGAKSKRDDSDGQDPEEHGGRDAVIPCCVDAPRYGDHGEGQPTGQRDQTIHSLDRPAARDLLRR